MVVHADLDDAVLVNQEHCRVARGVGFHFNHSHELKRINTADLCEPGFFNSDRETTLEWDLRSNEVVRKLPLLLSGLKGGKELLIGLELRIGRERRPCVDLHLNLRLADGAREYFTRGRGGPDPSAWIQGVRLRPQGLRVGHVAQKGKQSNGSYCAHIRS